ncbi:aspartyl/asparaginyl beta-hydroxylase domain-containing protein [Thermaurantiacus sp.]
MLLAEACARAGDLEGAEEGLRRELHHRPRNIRALLAMGELRLRRSDPRAATSYFRAALNQAAVVPPPAALRPLLDRARQHLAEAEAAFAQHLLAALGERPPPRVAHAIDLLTGRVPLYLQQPSMFYFPGLPQRAFYEREEFPWLAAIEAETPAMAAEAQALLEAPGALHPYVETPRDRPPPNNPLRDDPAWSACYFWRSGAVVEANAARAPAIMAALRQAPMPAIAGRSPIALLSVLRPGTHIAPHHGVLNTRLIVHVPLIPAPDCGLRVGHETRGWEPGRALVFDDSIEHEAWNRGPGTRAVLLFEIWRPEISAGEREVLVRLFETIERFAPDAAGSGGDQ